MRNRPSRLVYIVLTERGSKAWYSYTSCVFWDRCGCVSCACFGIHIDNSDRVSIYESMWCGRSSPCDIQHCCTRTSCSEVSNTSVSCIGEYAISVCMCDSVHMCVCVCVCVSDIHQPSAVVVLIRVWRGPWPIIVLALIVAVTA